MSNQIIKIVEVENTGWGAGMFAWIFTGDKLLRVPCCCSCGMFHLKPGEEFSKELDCYNSLTKGGE